jgi:hypothetical protein
VKRNSIIWLPAPLASWMQSCRTHLASLCTHIQELRSRIKGVSQTDSSYDHDICTQLRYSLIVCLTTLAKLCDLVANRIDPEGAVVFWERRERALRDILDTTKCFTNEDINYLDPFMGASCLHSHLLSSSDPALSSGLLGANGRAAEKLATRSCRTHTRENASPWSRAE